MSGGIRPAGQRSASVTPTSFISTGEVLALPRRCNAMILRNLLRAMGLVAIVSVASIQVCGQDSKLKKEPIYFECQCEDQVGQLVATSFRDELSRSPRYYSASAAEIPEANGKVERAWHVQALSMDIDDGNIGSQSAISVVLLIGNTDYQTQSMRICGRNRADQCAAEMFADLDQWIQKSEHP